jgi:hypothetical protein
VSHANHNFPGFSKKRWHKVIGANTGLKIGSNELLKSAIHKSLTYAITELGLPEFSQEQFTREISPLLRNPLSTIEDSEATRVKLWKSTLRGEVFATEVRNDDTLVLYVRSALRGTVIDLRLTCRNLEWHIEEVISMHSRPIVHSPWFYRATFVGAVIVAGVVGYALHQPTEKVVTQQVAAVPSASTSVAQATRAAEPSAKPKTSKPSPPQTFSFTLSHGMSLYDLCKFLQAHHLVDNAMGFAMTLKKTGVEKDVHPGTYTFKSGMNESQILQVLKQGPKK